MSKAIAAGLMCLGIATLGLALCRGQEPENSKKGRDDAPTQEIIVEQAKAAVMFAERNLQIQQLQNECDIAAAKMRHELATLDHKIYTDGEMIHEKDGLQADVKLAQEELTRATDRYASVKEAAKANVGAQEDVNISRVAVVKAQIQLQLAEGKLELHVNFNSQRRITELQARQRQSELALKLVELKADTALARARVELAAAKRSLDAASKAAGHTNEKAR
jgi:HlyD family secretion protein